MLTGCHRQSFCGGSAEKGADAGSTGRNCPRLPDTTTHTNTFSEVTGPQWSGSTTFGETMNVQTCKL
ncbi:hypothetical protein PAMP_019666 [Pampus punctatissimus]